ncbi:hypothetical protein BD626DRAFT_15034 [Schizophyllum amplum]|uniref:Uncharacterized protein n=1 Tax=Schizophyllum amplum TaxID=97359 RepID=A0A550CXS3_9AGAR|nr:hypothetical protein BD626DRAFT_15034 [Auriculariopsis ampla]
MRWKPQRTTYDHLRDKGNSEGARRPAYAGNAWLAEELSMEGGAPAVHYKMSWRFGIWRVVMRLPCRSRMGLRVARTEDVVPSRPLAQLELPSEDDSIHIMQRMALGSLFPRSRRFFVDSNVIVFVCIWYAVFRRVEDSQETCEARRGDTDSPLGPGGGPASAPVSPCPRVCPQWPRAAQLDVDVMHIDAATPRRYSNSQRPLQRSPP